MQSGICAGVRCNERWRTDRRHILGVLLFFLHQFGAGNVHQFDGHADEANIADIWRLVRARARKANIGGVSALGRKDPMSHMNRKIIANCDRGPHQSVGFGITAPLVTTWFEVPPHLIGHQVDNCRQTFFLIGIVFFFCEFQSVIGTSDIVQKL